MGYSDQLSSSGLYFDWQIETWRRTVKNSWSRILWPKRRSDRSLCGSPTAGGIDGRRKSVSSVLMQLGICNDLVATSVSEWVPANLPSSSQAVQWWRHPTSLDYGSRLDQPWFFRADFLSPKGKPLPLHFHRVRGRMGIVVDQGYKTHRGLILDMKLQFSFLKYAKNKLHRSRIRVQRLGIKDRASICTHIVWFWPYIISMWSSQPFPK
jgi:hypothetical protein